MRHVMNPGKLRQCWKFSMTKEVLHSSGYCFTCDREVQFYSEDAWLRDHFVCANCGSIPRERALMYVIDSFFPNWRDAVIHESSPGGRGASVRLKKECKNYIPSQYFPDRAPGSCINGSRCENLEAMSFDNESIDLHITQDVLEHVFHPSMVFKEIARTLKPGGMHIFTVPLVNKVFPSRLRACVTDNDIVYLEPEVYHGNPVGNGKSLVTVDWGYDICHYIFNACGLFTQLIYIDDLSKGIRAEYIEVLVTLKPATHLKTSIP